MTDTPKWRRYLRFWRPDVEGDVEDELRFHFDARTAELRAHGLSADEARRQAAEEFGDEAVVRARLHEIDHRIERRRARFLWWDGARADLRYALRGLRSNPLFTAAVVLTLAVGIGAATTMYGVMRRLLIQPPPGVTAPERVRRLYFHYEEPGDEPSTGPHSSYPFFQEIRADHRVLDAVAVYDRMKVAVGQGQDAELADATLVSAGFWRVLGVRPALGRLIADDEAHPVTGTRVVVLGHAFWQRRFGGDRDVVGRTLLVKGLPYQIVGVAPRGFRGVELAGTDVWLPLLARGDGGNQAPTWHISGTSHNLAFVARLRPGVSPARAQAELSRRFGAFVDHLYVDGRGYPPEVIARNAATRKSVRLAPLSGALGSDMTRIPEATVSVWLVGVAFVLLAIACANVASLLLMRALRRRREIGVRLALGMSRRRLAALLLVESLLLALLGGTMSVGVMIAGGAWVRRVLLSGMAPEPVGMDWHVLLVAAGCTLGTAIATGLAPVLQTRGQGLVGLREGGQHGATRRSRAHWALLVAQTALSMVLLVGAGLFLQSLRRIGSLDLGLDARDVLTVSVDLASAGRTPAERAAFYRRALERVRAIPGVEHASLAQGIPLRSGRGGSLRLPGTDEWAHTEQGAVPFMNTVGDDFFAATGMRLVRGRGFTAADRTGAPVVVVNEALARLVWPGGSPIGACVNTPERPDECTTVIGVVADARTFSLREEQYLWFYEPLAPDDDDVGVLLVRRTPGLTGMEATLRRTLRELDPNLPYIDIRVLGDVLDPQIRPWRLGATLFTTFGIIAMVLAALGLYAAVAYAVAQRTREIGVRVAVGATTGNVVRLVLGDGVRVAVAGIAAGLALALAGGPLIADLLFDVSPRDPLVLAAVGGGVLLAALLASLLPARRAARVDPVTALRVD
ncbi:MAG TPA: ADOP family duplicated permease [Gemmatimonadaceae bacterium]|nr:ADOP family duplicated permease [Gemmatimonadaceae bacterium]